MSILGDKQSKFTLMTGQLIIKAYDLGYELSYGDAYRDSRCPYGHIKSLHRERLAVDFNIKKDGVLLEGEEADKGHNELHDFWDSEGGSRRIEGDLGHYSLSHYGMI